MCKNLQIYVPILKGEHWMGLAIDIPSRHCWVIDTLFGDTLGTHGVLLNRLVMAVFVLMNVRSFFLLFLDVHCMVRLMRWM